MGTWALIVMAACDRGGDGGDRRPGDVGPQEDTSGTGDSGAGTTDSVYVPPVLVPCTDVRASSDWAPGAEQGTDLRLDGTWELGIGFAVVLAQLDDDDCDELLLGLPVNTWRIQSNRPPEPAERVVAFDEVPTASGPAGELGRTVVKAWYGELSNEGEEVAGEMSEGSRLGESAAYDERTKSLFVGATNNPDWFDIAAFDVGASDQRPIDDQGRIVASRDMIEGSTYGGIMGKAVGVVDLPLQGRVLWTGTYQTIGPSPFSGEIYLYDLPLADLATEDDARAVLRADSGDLIQTGYSVKTDLDGDGFVDFVLGTTWRGVFEGGVVVVGDPPDGDHNLWELAFASVEGETEGHHLGEHVNAGDLDGDGHAELIAGHAPVLGPGKLRLFQGPVQGTLDQEDSAWVIEGEEDYHRVGTSSAIADLDGDGAVDLAVGARANGWFSVEDGRVLLYRGPVAPGTHLESDADVVVTSPTGQDQADFFGFSLHTGRLDGDPLPDLVISAPYALDEAGRPAGAVHVLFGRAELFP